ncbi:MAG: response regulator transcription factor [Hyphomicrobiales bacterium]|nr:response regulator transcription factor [Hyphomicrobiales bacterium]
MTDKPHIVVIEDDTEIRNLTADFLKRHGFRVDVGDGAAALDRLLLTYGAPDLIVLDVMLPGEDGLSICRRLRAASRVPIIMLTARGEVLDRIIGLEMGADDYIPKPFNPRELVARIRAILRRNEQQPLDKKRIATGDLKIDLYARKVTHNVTGPLTLTSAEFDLLECFITHPGRVLSRDQLLDWTRGRRSDGLDRTIDVQLSRLRRKLNPDGEAFIKTVRGAGYILVAPVSEA